MTKQTERKSVITTTVSDDLTYITFHVKDVGDLTLDMLKCDKKILDRARVHGFIQRVSDKAAIARNTDTGLPVSPQEKFEAMRAMVDHFMSGTTEWNIKRAEGAGRKSGGLDGIAIDAVAEATGKTPAEVRDIIKAGSEAKKVTPAVYLAALSNAAKVKPILERMREEAAERAELDGDELLEGLGE